MLESIQSLFPMSYLRAFSTLGCPQATLEECLALAARFGLDGVELRALAGTVELPAYLARTYGSPEALAERMAARPGAGRRPAGIVSLDTSFRLVEADPAMRDDLLAFVPWAEALEVRWLRVFDGGKLADAAETTRALESLRWWRGERERRGWTVDLMVETHDSLFTAATIQRFCESAEGAAILWDSHHTWKKGGEDPELTWSRIAPHVVHVHVKDSVPVPGPRHPYTYVLPGEGEFPIGFLSRLDGFAGTVSLEWEKLWHPTLPELELALQSAHDRRWW